MAISNRRPLFLILFVLMSFTIPQPTFGTPLFDLSVQIDAINKIDLQADSIDTFFDTVTTLTSFEHICQTIPETNSLHQQTQLLISMQHAMIYLLMPLMSMVKRYQAYWQEQLHRPYAYFLSKPPHKWFRGKPQKEDLQDTLKMLTIIENNIAEHIGTLKNHLDEYAKVQTKDELQEIVEQQQAFLVAFFGNSLQSDFKANMTLIGDGFAQYHKSIYDLARTYKRANHFSRNWIAYTTAGLCLGAAACWYFKNPTANKTWIQSIITKRNQEAGNFWTEYVVKPIRRGYAELFYSSPPPQIYNKDSVQEKIDSVHAATVIFNEMNVDLTKTEFYVDYPKLESDLKNNPEHSQEIIEKFMEMHGLEMMHIARLLGYKGYVTKWDINILQTIRKCAALIRLEVGFELTSVKDSLNRASNVIDHIYEMLHGIMPFIAIIPAWAVSYISFTGAKAAYQKIAPHKTAHQGILVTLLQVEELLNDNVNTDVLETKDLGILTYYLGLLYEYSQDLSMQEHYDFCKDLNKLFNTTHTMSQKLKDIDIIRKKYQFLA